MSTFTRWLIIALFAATTPMPAALHAQVLQSLPNLTLTSQGDVLAILRQADGSMIVGGGFQSINGQARSNIARLLPDGSLDPVWNPGIGGHRHATPRSRSARGRPYIRPLVRTSVKQGMPLNRHPARDQAASCREWSLFTRRVRARSRVDAASLVARRRCSPPADPVRVRAETVCGIFPALGSVHRANSRLPVFAAAGSSSARVPFSVADGRSGGHFTNHAAIKAGSANPGATGDFDLSRFLRRTTPRIYGNLIAHADRAPVRWSRPWPARSNAGQ